MGRLVVVRGHIPALSRTASASASARSRCRGVVRGRLRRGGRESVAGWGCRSSSARAAKNRWSADRLVQTRRPTRTYSRETPRSPLRHHRQRVQTETFLPSTLGRHLAAWASVISSSSEPTTSSIELVAFAASIMQTNIRTPGERVCCAGALAQLRRSFRASYAVGRLVDAVAELVWAAPGPSCMRPQRADLPSRPLDQAFSFNRPNDRPCYRWPQISRPARQMD